VLGITWQLWNLKTGALAMSSPPSNTPVFWTEFSPDSKFVFTGYHFKTTMAEVPSGEVRQEYKALENLLCGAISPDKRWLATSFDTDRSLRLQEIVARRDSPISERIGPVRALAFSPNSGTLASGSDDAVIRLWDPDTAVLQARLEGHRRAVLCVAFDPNGKALATTSRDCTARLWDAVTHQQRANLLGHNRAVNCAAFSPDGKTMATASDDHSVRLWHVATGQELITLEGHTGPVRYVAFYPDGGRLLSIGAGADGRAELLVWSATHAELAIRNASSKPTRTQ
jgi:WD40 repeat protein